MSEDSSLGNALFSVTLLNIFLKVLKYKETYIETGNIRAVDAAGSDTARGKTIKKVEMVIYGKLFL